MIVVSGCPRSGTSLMMDLMRVTFGEDRLHGEKFPQEKRIKYLDEPHEGEDKWKFQCRQYLQRPNYHKVKEEFEETKDMNPNGFWEGLYSVQGVYYRFHDHENLKKLENEKRGEKTIAKIVSQGLIASDPKYIDKIVYMIRHPRAVAKSQERLKRFMPVEPGPNDDEIKIHTPEMYIKVTGMAARWLLTYPDVPVLHVHFDALIEKPKETLTEIQSFIDDGDFSKAIKQIEPKLRRSLPEDIPHHLWEEAEKVYELFCAKDYQGVVDYLKEDDRKIHREGQQFMCPRRGLAAVENQCIVCRSENPTVRENFKKYSEQHGIDWVNEPCMYECGLGPGPNYKTIDESIINNHWRD